MKTKTRNILIAIIIALAVALFATATYIIVFGASNETVVWTQTNLQPNYNFGDELELPSCSASIDGATVGASTTLVWPDGRESSNKQVVLTQSGNYTVRYLAKKDSSVYLKEESFRVNAKYVVVGNNSSASYTDDYAHLPGSPKDEPEKALNVRLAQGDTLKFSQPIDLSSVTQDNILIEMMAKPDSLGSTDFTHIEVTFTDIEDPAIFMTVVFDAYGGAVNGNRAFTLAKGNGQPARGYYHQGDNLILNTNQSGTSTAHSFAGYKNDGDDITTASGVIKNGDYMFNSLKLAYDYAQKQVYINGRYVIDLDSPECFPEGIWDGFHSGRVFMSMTASGYTSATANFNVYSVYGMDFAANQEYEDEDAPVITVYSDYEEMPVAMPGVVYTIPRASAFDEIDGSLKVNTEVYFNFNSNDVASVRVQNNTFAVDKVGYYAIRYTAKDYSGNRAEAIVWVRSVPSVDPITIAVAGGDDSGIAGTYITVRHAEYFGGSGKLVFTSYAEYKDNRIAIEDETFLADGVGEYVVHYVVEDFIGQRAEESYRVNVLASEKPVFLGAAQLPSVFISGSEYQVPKYVAFDYSSGAKQEIVASCTVNGQTYQAGEKFIPQVSGDKGEVTLTFTAGSSTEVVTVPCVKVWGTTGTGRPKLSYEKYFYSADDSVLASNLADTSTGSGIQLKAVKTEAHAVFANKIYQDMASVVLSGVNGANDFSSLTITLRDSIDKSVAVTAQFFITSTNTLFRAGTDKTLTYHSGTSDTLTVSYSNGAFIANNISNDIKRTANGKVFEGFKSGYVDIEFTFSGVAGEAAMVVKEIGNQVFGTLTSDSIEPRIFATQTLGGAVSKGTVITIPRAAACDVLDPNVHFTLTVTGPDNMPVSDVNGIVMRNVDPTVEYTLQFETLGTYYVTYTAADVFNASPNEARYRFSVVVEDTVAPTLEIYGRSEYTAKVGDVFVIPNMNYYDDVTAKENLIVLRSFMAPNGRIKELNANSNCINLTEKGNYRIFIMVVDEAGNSTTKTISVTVTD